MRYLWKQRQRSWRTTFLLSYLTLLLMIETVFCIVQARTVQVIYIENRNYPGGPWAYFLDTQYLAINVMFYATLFVLTFLCDLLVVRVVIVPNHDCVHTNSSSQLWRCWIIWTASGRAMAYAVTAFPTIILLASFGSSFLSVLAHRR